MKHYLLELYETFPVGGEGTPATMTKFVVTAESEARVKYHFHREMHDLGYEETGKHLFETDNHSTEIESIIEIDAEEWDVLREYLPKWRTE